MKTSFLKHLTLLAAIIAFCVIGLGAFTRLLDAGLGCPDWPGCYGHIIPNGSNISGEFVSYKAWAEMIHRYAVSVLSFFILAIVISVFAKKQFRTRANVIFSLLLIVLTVYQIMLGQWTVTLKLLPVIVSQHLLGGFFILACLWLIYLSISYSVKQSESWIASQKTLAMTKGFETANPLHCEDQEARQSSSLTPKDTRHCEERKRRSNLIVVIVCVGLLLLLTQVFLGAWTSTNYASLSCPDFPFCMNDKPFMTFHLKEAYNLFSPVGVNYQGGVLAEPIRQTIQMMHRSGALIVSIYLFILFSIGIKQTPNLQKILYAIMAVLLLQLCLGMANVLFKLPLLSAVLHTLGAALLLLSLLTYLFYLLQGDK